MRLLIKVSVCGYIEFADTNDIHGLAYCLVVRMPNCNHRLCDSATHTLNSTIAAVVDMNLATYVLPFRVLFEQLNLLII